jgi:flagellar hook-associated protein 2
MASISSTSTTGLGLTGLSSGLDTSGIITKLMAIEAAPQTQLKSQLSTLQTHTTALQSLNTVVASVATTAKAALSAGALSSFTATSSSTAATATASSSAAAGSVSFTVDRLAAAQVSVTGAMTAWPDTAAMPHITIQVGSGSTATTKTVSAASNAIDDVVTAINAAGTGVTATKIAAGTDASGVVQYRLQLTGRSGEANAFALFQGDDATGTPVATTQVGVAQDARIVLYGGTSAEQQVTSATNTFTSLLSGVDVTVSAASTTPIRVDVAADATAATTSATALTSGLVSLFSGIASATTITTSSSATGGSSSSATTGSVFTGDTLVRTVKDSLLSAVSDPVNGRSPSSIGISLTKTGTITFDSNAFAAAMKSDPAGTTAMYQAIAGRVSTAASAASDAYSGSISQAVTSEQARQSDMTSRISDWDTRLAAIQAQYQLQFNNLETALNSLSAQGTYLSSQITGLTTNYQSK